MVDLSIIVAKAANGVIGAGNTIPWHLPADLKRFKAMTMGCPLVMGRKTWDSLPIKPLPGRPHFIVSRTPQAHAVDGVFGYTAPETAFAAAIGWVKAQGKTQAFVIGGAELYARALQYVDILHITQLEKPFDGDVTFPTIDDDHWSRIENHVFHAEDDQKAPCGYSFQKFVRHDQHPATSLIDYACPR